MDLYDYIPNSVALIDDKYAKLLSIFQTFEITTSELLSRSAKEIVFLTSIKVGAEGGKSYDESIYENDETLMDLSSDQDGERHRFMLIPELGAPEVQEFQKIITEEINKKITYHNISKVEKFSSGCLILDKLLGGGVPLGYVIEIAGESSVGKTQLLLQLSVFCQKNYGNDGTTSFEGKSVFISTEAHLPLKRIKELINANFADTDERPSLDNIITIFISDWQKQAEFVIFHQLPELLKKDKNIKLLLIDSISHHLRSNLLVDESEEKECDQQIIVVAYLIRLYNYFEMLAGKYNIAIVMANQVTSQLIPQYDINDINPNNVFDYNYQIGNMCGWDSFTAKLDQFLCYNEEDDPQKDSYLEKEDNFCFTELDKIQIQRSLEAVRKFSYTSTPEEKMEKYPDDSLEKSADDEVIRPIEYSQYDIAQKLTRNPRVNSKEYRIAQPANDSEAIRWKPGQNYSVPVLSINSNNANNTDSFNNNVATVHFVPENSCHTYSYEDTQNVDASPYADDSMDIYDGNVRPMVNIQRIVPCLSVNSWWNNIPIRLYLSKSSNEFEITQKKMECKTQNCTTIFESPDILFHESDVIITIDLLLVDDKTNDYQIKLIKSIMSQMTIYECLKDKSDTLSTEEDKISWDYLVEKVVSNLRELTIELKISKGSQVLFSRGTSGLPDEEYDKLLDSGASRKHFFLKLINSPFQYSSVSKEVEISAIGYKCIV